MNNAIHTLLTENEILQLEIGEAIHQSLGAGLLESVYEECFTHRLIQSGLAMERQQPIPLDGWETNCE